jgi:hypothetical protein
MLPNPYRLHPVQLLYDQDGEVDLRAETLRFAPVHTQFPLAFETEGTIRDL